MAIKELKPLPQKAAHLPSEAIYFVIGVLFGLPALRSPEQTRTWATRLIFEKYREQGCFFGHVLESKQDRVQLRQLVKQIHDSALND